MTPYWLLFLFSAYLAVSKQRHSSLISSEKSWSFLWQMFFLLIAIFIGLRHQVGGDWLSYLVNTEETKNLTLSEAFAVSRGDPADSLLKWVSSNSGLGVYLINLTNVDHVEVLVAIV